MQRTGGQDQPQIDTATSNVSVQFIESSSKFLNSSMRKNSAALKLDTCCLLRNKYDYGEHDGISSIYLKRIPLA